jgi:hypothetical protein
MNIKSIERNKLEWVFDIACGFYGSLVDSTSGIFLKFPCADTKQGFIEACKKIGVKVEKAGSNQVEILV